MAYLKEKALFFTTSPRTPSKMIPEIELLANTFSGKSWNAKTQVEFTRALAMSDFFEGNGSSKDEAFSGRDRINRAPKSLGFVDLKPVIALTSAGKDLIYGKHQQETFLRQLLKFQLPSPYHIENSSISGTFCIKPYLEIFRLIRELEYLTFDEFKIFAVKLTNHHSFHKIKKEILNFRGLVGRSHGRYAQIVNAIWIQAIEEIYGFKISTGDIKTRETKEKSLAKFLATKKSNLRDYADAGFRYLRFTGLVSLSHKGRSLSIFPDKLAEVDFFLNTIERDPCFVDEEDKYKAYLFSANSPKLYWDNQQNLINYIIGVSGKTEKSLSQMSVSELKDVRSNILIKKQNSILDDQVTELKSYSQYVDIIETYNDMRNLYDAPLIFEWNTWRAMTMLDGGIIKGNFRIDDFGNPLSTAQGNMPDIECTYDDFSVAVEVTMQSGQRQYETEGEPVARHYASLKKKTGKETYCIFIAPIINRAALAHFFVTNRMDVSYYEGKTRIIPLNLDQFITLIDSSYNYRQKPTSKDVRDLFDSILKKLNESENEAIWSENIQNCISSWLVN